MGQSQNDERGTGSLSSSIARDNTDTNISHIEQTICTDAGTPTTTQVEPSLGKTIRLLCCNAAYNYKHSLYFVTWGSPPKGGGSALLERSLSKETGVVRSDLSAWSMCNMSKPLWFIIKAWRTLTSYISSLYPRPGFAIVTVSDTLIPYTCLIPSQVNVCLSWWFPSRPPFLHKAQT